VNTVATPVGVPEKVSSASWRSSDSFPLFIFTAPWRSEATSSTP
jgi:hypothetical protein